MFASKRLTGCAVMPKPRRAFPIARNVRARSKPKCRRSCAAPQRRRQGPTISAGQRAGIHRRRQHWNLPLRRPVNPARASLLPGKWPDPTLTSYSERRQPNRPPETSTGVSRGAVYRIVVCGLHARARRSNVCGGLRNYRSSDHSQPSDVSHISIHALLARIAGSSRQCRLRAAALTRDFRTFAWSRQVIAGHLGFQAHYAQIAPGIIQRLAAGAGRTSGYTLHCRFLGFHHLNSRWRPCCRRSHGRLCNRVAGPCIQYQKQPANQANPDGERCHYFLPHAISAMASRIAGSYSCVT